MEYLLKASGIVAIFFLFYYIFLKNETYFKSIRVYFLIGLVVVISIPLIEIPVYIESVAVQLSKLDYQEMASTNFIEENGFDWIQFIIFIYLIGVLFFSLKFLVQLTSLGFLLSNHQLEKKENYYLVETSKNSSPFSFFNIIVFNKSQFSIAEIEQILNHEKAHVLQWHSIDTILAHLLVITLWFNPFVWLYKKAVQQNLEFLADEYALELAEDKQLYQLTLLKTCYNNYCTEITNNFYNSLIKKRIVMLHKNRSKNKGHWKYVLLLPFLITFVAAFSTKIIAQEKKLTDVQEFNELKVELIIDKNSTSETLKREAAFFKKEFDINLSFKGIKRNTNNEITAIKIDAKGEHIETKFENTGTNPIKPIKISYNDANNFLSIGNVSKMKIGHYNYKVSESGDIEFKGKPDKDGNFVFVTSDGKTKTWTSKGDKSKNIELKIISEKGDEKNVWVTKDGNKKVNIEVIELDEGKKKVKIIKNGNALELDNEIEFIEEKDGEQIFIIKNTKGKKYKVSNDVSASYIDEAEKPLVFIDGKESTRETLEKLDSDKIKEMMVLKGEKATEKYGEKAKDGVVIITTKKE